MRTRTMQAGTGGLAAVLLLALVPSVGAAQYQSQCVNNTQCPNGTFCMNGACVQQQQQGQPQYQQQQGQPQYQGQAQAGGVQVQGQVQVQQGQPYQGQPQYQQGQQPYQGQAYGAQNVVLAQPMQGRTVSGHMIGLIVAGAVSLGVSYITNVLVSALGGVFSSPTTYIGGWTNFDNMGYIPLVGPWIQLGVKPGPFNRGWGTYLIIDGLVQAAGLAMLIVGLAVPVERTVYASRDGHFALNLDPLLGPRQAGLLLSGHFF